MEGRDLVEPWWAREKDLRVAGMVGVEGVRSGDVGWEEGEGREGRGAVSSTGVDFLAEFQNRVRAAGGEPVGDFCEPVT